MPFFVKHDLQSMDPDFAVHLGHHGAPCPSRQQPIMTTITDCNGIHKTPIAYCHCNLEQSADDFQRHGEGADLNRIRQLINAGLFPGSAKAPTSAYTLSGLKLFHLLQMECKVNAGDFINTIRRITDSRFMTEPPVCLSMSFLAYWRLKRHRTLANLFWMSCESGEFSRASFSPDTPME
jgi:hypothetical protein